jgi:hypothetical protein
LLPTPGRGDPNASGFARAAVVPVRPEPEVYRVGDDAWLFGVSEDGSHWIWRVEPENDLEEGVLLGYGGA